MPKTFFRAHTDVAELVAAVMHEHHRGLHDAGVTVDCVMAESAGKYGVPRPAIKRNGYPCAAVIRISSLEDRARGVPDVRLTIDGNEWLKLPPLQRRSLVDHELQHIDVNPTKASKKRPSKTTDDLGRPRLKLRPHDWELMGFRDVVARNGENALEAIAIHRFAADYKELQLELFSPAAVEQPTKRHRSTKGDGDQSAAPAA